MAPASPVLHFCVIADTHKDIECVTYNSPEEIIDILRHHLHDGGIVGTFLTDVVMQEELVLVGGAFGQAADALLYMLVFVLLVSLTIISLLVQYIDCDRLTHQCLE